MKPFFKLLPVIPLFAGLAHAANPHDVEASMHQMQQAQAKIMQAMMLEKPSKLGVNETVDTLKKAAEARGWIYYRKKQASPGTSTSAFLELQSMLEPGRKHEIHAMRGEEEERDDEGEPPSPGANGGSSDTEVKSDSEMKNVEDEEWRIEN